MGLEVLLADQDPVVLMLCKHETKTYLIVCCQVHTYFEMEGFSLTPWSEGRDLWSEMQTDWSRGELNNMVEGGNSSALTSPLAFP